jgi:pimeloyl-ACP methyl ester carboxylesterase
MRRARKGRIAAVAVVAIVLAIGIGFYLRPLSFLYGLIAVQMRLAGAHSEWVTVQGHQIHYYTLGPKDAPPLVMVHGLGGSAADFRNLAPYLLAAGFRIYLPDLPGFGKSEQPADFSYSIPDQAAIVVGFMDALGLKQVDLGGFSMGGWIVQRIAYDHPERVKRLMLFDSAGINEQPAYADFGRGTGAIRCVADAAPSAGAGVCAARSSANLTPRCLDNSSGNERHAGGQRHNGCDAAAVEDAGVH